MEACTVHVELNDACVIHRTDPAADGGSKFHVGLFKVPDEKPVERSGFR
jgi:hypothetical protein